MALFKKQSTTILLYFLDEYSNLKTIKALVNAVEGAPLRRSLARKLDANGTDDLWKDIYDVCTDTTQTTQLSWYASTELSQSRADRKT